MRKHWSLVVVLAIQLAILAAIPAKKIMARASGATVVLKTAPVDPYDILSGYYVILAYEVQREARKYDHQFSDGDVVWLNLVHDEPAW